MLNKPSRPGCRPNCGHVLPSCRSTDADWDRHFVKTEDVGSSSLSRPTILHRLTKIIGALSLVGPTDARRCAALWVGSSSLSRPTILHRLIKMIGALSLVGPTDARRCAALWVWRSRFSIIDDNHL